MQSRKSAMSRESQIQQETKMALNPAAAATAGTLAVSELNTEERTNGFHSATSERVKKVTLYIDKVVFKKFKMCAVREDTTLSALAERVLADYSENCTSKD